MGPAALRARFRLGLHPCPSLPGEGERWLVALSSQIGGRLRSSLDILGGVQQGVDEQRAVVEAALRALGVDWGAWPAVLTDPRLDVSARLSGVIMLLALTDGRLETGPQAVSIDPSDDSLDWLGRAREPWSSLARMRLPWTAATATTALSVTVGRGPYDDRRIALALRGARQVCSAGQADARLMDALARCVAYLEDIERSGRWENRLLELLERAQRIIAWATPPELLDLSLLVDGDTWAAPAREAARAEPHDDIAPLVRLLGDLGPRKPPRSWSQDVAKALEPAAAQRLLRRWMELASDAQAVPEWPGSRIGACRGTLFVGSNTNLVRAAVWATSVLPAETWPIDHLVRLATRGEKHNGAAGLPEALALKVAAAAIDTLVARGAPEDQIALTELLGVLQRKDLRKKIATATNESPV